MKDSNLEQFKNYEIPKKMIKYLFGGSGGCCGALDGCVETAESDGNEWLIPECTRVLGGCCF